MVGGSISLFVDKFRLENKEFRCSIGKDGRIVRIVEEFKGKVFSIFVQRKAAAWLRDKTVEISEAFQPAFFRRRFSDNSSSFIIDVLENKRGRCIRILKVAQGDRKIILVPEGRNLKGWLLFSRSLSNILRDWNKEQHVSLVPEVKKVTPKPSVQSVANGPSFKEVVENRSRPAPPPSRGKVSSFESTAPRHFTSKTSDPKCVKDWDFAVLVCRLKGVTQWKVIFQEIQRRTGKVFSWSPFAGNKAVVWCSNEEERDLLLRLTVVTFKKEEAAFISRWSEEELWKGQKVFLKNSWIGIEGLPIHLWNHQTLKEIGDKLGGLIEVAKETLDLSFLQFAKIRCKGFGSGLIEPDLLFGKSGLLCLFNLGAPFMRDLPAVTPGRGSPSTSLGTGSRVDSQAEADSNHCAMGSGAFLKSHKDRESSEGKGITPINDCTILPSAIKETSLNLEGAVIKRRESRVHVVDFTLSSVVGDNEGYSTCDLGILDMDKAVCSQVGPILDKGPTAQVNLVFPTVSDVGFHASCSRKNEVWAFNTLGPSKSLVLENTDNLDKSGPSRWRPKQKHLFCVATIARWNDFIREKRIVPRARKAFIDYDSDSDLMRDRMHGNFFSRRQREDQEASSPFCQEPGIASDKGGVEFVVEEELGLAEDDGVSDLEDGSSEESFSTSLEEGEIEPEDCLDGLALTFGVQNLSPPDLMPSSEADTELTSFPTPPLDAHVPPTLEASTPSAPSKRAMEGSGKSSRVKGQNRELRNLEFEMSFGKAKEFGLSPRNQ